MGMGMGMKSRVEAVVAVNGGGRRHGRLHQWHGMAWHGMGTREEDRLSSPCMYVCASNATGEGSFKTGG